MSDKRIRWLDINKDIPNNARILAIGRPKTGKSSLLKALMYAKRHVYPVCQIYSESDVVNKFFQSFVPESFIFNEFNETAASSAWDRQTRCIKRGLENPNNLVVFDDVISDASTLNCKIVNKMMKFSRQYHMSVILAIQGLMDFKSNLRNLVDFIFILNEGDITTRRKLYKYYAGSWFSDEREFNEAMDVATQDYNILVINNTTQSNKFQDRVFYFKANLDEIPKDWKFGCESFSDYHNKKFEKQHDD